MKTNPMPSGDTKPKLVELNYGSYHFALHETPKHGWMIGGFANFQKPNKERKKRQDEHALVEYINALELVLKELRELNATWMPRV